MVRRSDLFALLLIAVSLLPVVAGAQSAEPHKFPTLRLTSSPT